MNAAFDPRRDTDLQHWLRRIVDEGNLDARTPWYRDTFPEYETVLTFWNFMRAGTRPASKAWVMRNAFSVQGRSRVSWEALRALPETGRELRQWGFTGRGVARTSMLGYNSTYNRRVRMLIRGRGYTLYQAHRHVVSTMDQQARDLMWEHIFALVLSAGSAAATMNLCDVGTSGAGGFYQVRETLRGDQ